MNVTTVTEQRHTISTPTMLTSHVSILTLKGNYQMWFKRYDLTQILHIDMFILFVKLKTLG